MDTKKIRKLMIDLDLSMNDLARLTGYSRVHLSYVIYGHRKSQRAARRILKALADAREQQAA